MLYIRGFNVNLYYVPYILKQNERCQSLKLNSKLPFTVYNIYVNYKLSRIVINKVNVEYAWCC